jgi:hypothetical protein
VPTSPARDERPRQFLIGLAVLATLVVLGVLVGLGTRLPGFPGECFRLIVGFCTTPFFLEFTFVVLGLIIVLALNHWRRHRDGDELVYLDQVSGPDVPADLPDHARFAVFTEPPAEPVEPSALDRAEGALAIGDTTAATEALAELDEAALQSPAALRVRIALAQATGRTDLAEELARRLNAPASGRH